jgi:hypothetical protein
MSRKTKSGDVAMRQIFRILPDPLERLLALPIVD